MRELGSSKFFRDASDRTVLEANLASDEPGVGARVSDDELYLGRAIELAEQAAQAGDVPIGAVFVSGDLVLEAKNEKELRRDPTAHAEILLLREAAGRLDAWRLSDATLFVTKEPCVMCAGAIVAARIKRLVYGAKDPKGGADGSVFDVLRSPKTNHRLEVTAGVLENETAEQLQRFFRERRSPSQEGITPASSQP